MDDVDIEECEATPPEKFHVVYLVTYVFALFANLCFVWKVFFAGLSQVFDRHAVYVGDRDRFEQSAGAEIERLVKGEVGTDG